MSNKTFLHAASLLCHPISIIAMLLLLFNDLWLRWYAPSWWTGKIGDFTWLFFIPFALAMLLALVIPSSPHQEQTVRVLAFGLTGGVFSLAKTIPVVHAWIVQIEEMTLNMPVGLRRDPSDLIALVSLGAAWWLWEHHTTLSASATPSVVAFLLAAMLTIADAPAPDYGITTFTLRDDGVIAASNYGTWLSTDGGLTWIQIGTDSQLFRNLPAQTDMCQNTLNSDVWYRSASTVSIERSDDQRNTWHIDYTLTPMSEAARSFVNHHWGGGLVQGLQDCIGEPRTGNMLFAMAHEGVLVRNPSGEYTWVAVDHYEHFLNDPILLLGGEVILALSFGLLILGILSVRLLQRRIAYVFPGIAGVVWVIDSIFFPPGKGGGGYIILENYLAIGVFGFVGIIVAVLVRLVARRSLRFVGLNLIVALVSVPLYFAPFYLWALNWIPNYSSALMIAFALGAVLLIVGWQWTTKFTNSIANNKKMDASTHTP